MRTRLIAILFLAGLVMPGCGGESKEEHHTDAPTGERETVTVTKKSAAEIGLTVHTASMRPVNVGLTAPATVITNQDLEAQVGSLVQGRVHKVFVNVGDAVTAGQTLMSVEGLDIGTIKAGFLKAKASRDYAQTVLERQRKLFDEKIGSFKSVLESQAEYDKALAEYKAEDRRIHSVGLTDEDVTSEKEGEAHTAGTLPIKSHIDGIVVERNVVVGQYVDATTNAFKVVNTRTVWIDGQIYEKDLPRIGAKTTAVFTTATYPNHVFTGRIIYIGQTVDERSRTITIRGEFANPGVKLKPQMFGELKIPVGANVDAVMIPQEAVVNEAGRQYVFIRTTDTTFEKRTVVTGASAGAMVEIRDGLKAGETVAVKGVFYFKSELKKEEFSGDEH